MAEGTPIHETPQPQLETAPEERHLSAQPLQSSDGLPGSIPEGGTPMSEPQGFDVEVNDPFMGLFGVPVEDPTGVGSPQDGGAPVPSEAAPQSAAPSAASTESDPAPVSEPTRVERLEAQVEALVNALSGNAPPQAEPPKPQGPQIPELPDVPKRPEAYSKFEAQNDPDSPSAKYDAAVVEYDDTMRQIQRMEIDARRQMQERAQYEARHRSLRTSLRDRAVESYGVQADEAEEFLDFVSNPKTLDDMDAWFAAYQASRAKAGKPLSIAAAPSQPAQGAPTPMQGTPQQAPRRSPQGSPLVEGVRIEGRARSAQFPATVASQGGAATQPPLSFEEQVAREINAQAIPASAI